MGVPDALKQILSFLGKRKMVLVIKKYLLYWLITKSKLPINVKNIACFLQRYCQLCLPL